LLAMGPLDGREGHSLLFFFPPFTTISFIRLIRGGMRMREAAWGWMISCVIYVLATTVRIASSAFRPWPKGTSRAKMGENHSSSFHWLLEEEKAVTDNRLLMGKERDNVDNGIEVGWNGFRGKERSRNGQPFNWLKIWMTKKRDTQKTSNTKGRTYRIKLSPINRNKACILPIKNIWYFDYSMTRRKKQNNSRSEGRRNYCWKQHQ
jgi:hypothetical protein